MKEFPEIIEELYILVVEVEKYFICLQSHSWNGLGNSLIEWQLAR